MRILGTLASILYDIHIESYTVHVRVQLCTYCARAGSLGILRAISLSNCPDCLRSESRLSIVLVAPITNTLQSGS